jgi:UDP-glucose 4-epimerase
MKILVTGGAGVIGSHVVDGLLAAGHHVAVIDDLSSGSRDNLPATVPLHVVDIVDGQAVRGVFERERPEAVCHQAAQMSVSRSVREPLFDAQVNCIGLINVLDAAPAPETTPANPVSPYGITKWVGERYLEFYAKEHGLAAVALRYSNVYGPRQNPHGEAGVVAIFCKKLLVGEPATINGDGRYVRDYVFGPDVAAANVAALTHDLPGVVPKSLTSLNIGTGIGVDVNELEAVVRGEVSRVLAERGRPAHLPDPLHGPARPGDLRSNLVSAARAGEVLGWRPTVAFPAGVARTVAWFAAAQTR